MTTRPVAEGAKAWDAAMEAAWKAFAERWRRTRAPAALRERIVAALAALEAREEQREGDDSHG